MVKKLYVLDTGEILNSCIWPGKNYDPCPDDVIKFKRDGVEHTAHGFVVEQKQGFDFKKDELVRNCPAERRWSHTKDNLCYRKNVRSEIKDNKILRIPTTEFNFTIVHNKKVTADWKNIPKGSKNNKTIDLVNLEDGHHTIILEPYDKKHAMQILSFVVKNGKTKNQPKLELKSKTKDFKRTKALNVIPS